MVCFGLVPDKLSALNAAHILNIHIALSNDSSANSNNKNFQEFEDVIASKQFLPLFLVHQNVNPPVAPFILWSRSCKT